MTLALHPLPPCRPRRVGAALALAACAWLAGCAAPRAVNVPFTTPGGVPIDVTYTAQGQDSRAMFLVLHYTVLNLQDSIRVLTQQQVSSHYLVTDENPPRILRLVDEDRRAWHAGFSSWQRSRMLNAASIGIEIVHPGARILPDGTREYLPYPPAQIDALIPLVQDIQRRHQIRPDRVVGHAEIQPRTKQDPGPTFPWKKFSELGITQPWPDEARVAAQRVVFEAVPPDIAWWQAALEKHGYEIDSPKGPGATWDAGMTAVLASFQMRWRPARYDGQPDAETAAILWVLTNPLEPVARR